MASAGSAGPEDASGLADKLLSVLSSVQRMTYRQLVKFRVFFGRTPDGSAGEEQVQEAIEQLLQSGDIIESNGAYIVRRARRLGTQNTLGTHQGVQECIRRMSRDLVSGRGLPSTAGPVGASLDENKSEKTVNLRHLGPDQLPHDPHTDPSNLQITFSCEGQPTRGFIVTVDLLERVLEFIENDDQLQLLKMLLDTTNTGGFLHNF